MLKKKLPLAPVLFTFTLKEAPIKFNTSQG